MLLKKKKNAITVYKSRIEKHFGINHSRMKTVNKKFGMDVQIPQIVLRLDQVASLESQVNKKFPLLDNRLKLDLRDSNKFLDQLRNRIGIRNKKGYPSRGQRTKTNGKTKKKFRT